jgi:hypothetical protein
VVATPVQRHVEREGQKPHGADSLQAAYRFKASFNCGAECPSLALCRHTNALRRCLLSGGIADIVRF